MGHSAKIRHQRRRRAARSGRLPEIIIGQQRNREARKLQAAVAFDSVKMIKARAMEAQRARLESNRSEKAARG